MKKRAVLAHLSKACPVVDLPIYGTLSQTDLPPNWKLVIICGVVFLKFLVILSDYGAQRGNRTTVS